MTSFRSRLLLLVLALALAAGPALAEGEGPAPAPPAGNDGKAPPAKEGDGKVEEEIPAYRLDKRAMRLVAAADRAIYMARYAKMEAFKGTMVIPKSQIGRLAVDFSWVRGEEGSDGTVELTVNASIDEKVRPLIESQVFDQLRPILDTVFLGRRLADAFKNCHLDYREAEDGSAEVVLTWADGPATGATEVLTFDPVTGTQTKQVTHRPDGTVASTNTRKWEKYQDRYRMVGATREVPGPGGMPVTIEMAVDWLECGGISVPWRMTQDLPMVGKVEFFLEGIVVNGKPWATPMEEEAAKPAAPAEEKPAAPDAPPKDGTAK